jgi:Ssp1 endopeptidase immunity protein Rap1a
MRKTYERNKTDYCSLFSGRLRFASTTMDGNTLLRLCNAAVELADSQKANGNVQDSNYCVGFVNGVMLMAFDESLKLGNSHAALACSPAQGVAGIQAVRIAVKYLKVHPESLHKDAHLLVVYALREAFPCK